MNQSTHTSSPALILAAWVLVGIPLSWGVWKSAQNVVKLFQATPSPAITSPAK